MTNSGAEELTREQSGEARSAGGAQVPGRLALWAGWILTALPVAMLALSAAMKLARHPMVVQTMGGKFGYPDATILPIGLLELCCALLLAVPRTALLGAALVTAYFGGAVATHVRVSDPFAGPIVLGVFAWVGVFLREPRLRPLFPLRHR
jgi:hypothetical protein